MWRSINLMLLLLLAWPAAAGEAVYLHAERASSCYNLTQRVQMLERTVERLQTRLLEMERDTARGDYGGQYRWSCSIETPFDGNYFSAGLSKREALGRVLRDCSDATNGSSRCSEFWAKCEQVR
jgi:hypothetical protein